VLQIPAETERPLEQDIRSRSLSSLAPPRPPNRTAGPHETAREAASNGSVGSSEGPRRPHRYLEGLLFHKSRRRTILSLSSRTSTQLIEVDVAADNRTPHASLGHLMSSCNSAATGAAAAPSTTSLPAMQIRRCTARGRMETKRHSGTTRRAQPSDASILQLGRSFHALFSSPVMERCKLVVEGAAARPLQRYCMSSSRLPQGSRCGGRVIRRNVNLASAAWIVLELRERIVRRRLLWNNNPSR